MGALLHAWSRSVAVLLIFATLLGVPAFSSVEAQTGPTLSGCPVFPANNVWNTAIDHLPVHPNSPAYINTIGPTRGLHPDFGSGLWDGGPIGIPYNVVSGTQPKVPIAFDYEDESDPGPYPIPPDALIEGGSQSTGDRHVLVLDKDDCILYEIFSAYPQPGGSWTAGSGAVFNLQSNALRPSGWTSADAAGLPILPGLVRYDEVASGEIRHALRFTAPQTKREFVWPARHYASSLTGASYPPMGLRFRLKANVVISGFSPEVQVILQAMKKYGMILADNGSAWYISGAPDSRWDNGALVSELREIKGSDFEAVDETSLMVNPDSGQAFTITPPTIYYVATQGDCGGKSPCFSTIQDGIDSADSFSMINVTQETYDEDVILDSPKVLSLRGGWDGTFTTCPSNTPVLGSLTINDGLVIIENIILQ